ncbi:hypothetical protein B0G69_4286 [Paraburkholderia sp. RAU2J]|nr:hypothetical protein B0G69_4286 [Paraburkholderia sp. RAU2J]
MLQASGSFRLPVYVMAALLAAAALPAVFFRNAEASIAFGKTNHQQ